MVIQAIQRFLRTKIQVRDLDLEFCVADTPWRSIAIRNLESIHQGSLFGFPILHITTRSGVHLVTRGSATSLIARLTQHLGALALNNLLHTQASIPSVYPTAPVLDGTWHRLVEERRDTIETLRSATAAEYLGGSTELQTLLELWEAFEAPGPARERYLHAYIQRELNTYKNLFDSIESQPLTQEQRLACVVSDDRQLLVAAAGSGKSSVIVAKVAYTLEKHWANPEEIVLLAFNEKACTELSKRCNKRLGRYAGHEKLVIKTFHGLGLELIGKYSQRHRKPTPSRLAANDGIRLRLALIRSLVEDSIAKDSSNAAAFGTLQSVMGTQAPPVTVKDVQPGKFTTLQGKVVKSSEELRIANFLFTRGIRYEYERAYEFDVSDPEHGQYKPDFFFPDIGVYYEHFAIDSTGKAPAHFPGYLEKTQWRRQIHARMGTRFFETLSADFESRKVYDKILYHLHTHGFDFEGQTLEQVALGSVEIIEPAMTALDRFIANRKLSGINDEELFARARAGSPWLLDVIPFAIAIADGYQAELSRCGEIDFTDMIRMATEAVETTSSDLGYRYLLIDEFQDISAIRADMIRAILARCPGSKLFCVGDDWQSINGFSGSDIRFMTQFQEEFGVGTRQDLTKTFRSCSGIAKVAAELVTRNPYQLKKDVVAHDPDSLAVIHVHFMEQESDFAEVMDRTLMEAKALYEKRANKTPVSVFSLARNWAFVNAEKAKPNEFEAMHINAIAQLQKQGEGILRVDYDTFHGSKGREADIVILNGLVNQKTNRRCFPSRMSKNELITLPLPQKERFPDAEERRLFYVALTRARKLVVIPTTFDDMSPFVHELFEYNHIEVELFHQGEVAEECPVCRNGIVTFKNGEIVCNSPDCTIGIHAHKPYCPACKTGRVIPRKSEYGVWFGCNNYPTCKFTDRERNKAMNTRRA